MTPPEPRSELRWHPLLRQWVVVAAHRQERPQLPSDWCPFCIGSGHVPDDYDVYLYPNDFPAFSLDNPVFAPKLGLFASTGARGACDVVVYSPDHNKLPSELPVEQWRKVIELWTRRTQELFARPDIEYVSIFENTGLAIGVTMPHPHGQIYGFPFLPPLAKTEVDSAEDHSRRQGDCLYCRILNAELDDGRRIVAANDRFVAFLPFFGRFPTEMHIYSRRHVQSLDGFSAEETDAFASLLSLARRKYDTLYGFPMPLMMLVRQRPAKGDHPYFHFHVEFLPIQRSAAKLKYLAAVESGNGTFLNDTRPEDEAEKLRRTEPVADASASELRRNLVLDEGNGPKQRS